jgi:geranylgeranyl diphosphate synthase type II
LRPLLVLLAAEACGGDFQRALPAACAVEMIHAYSLIHDDLPAMDDDDLRRGRPTCHKQFGEATAILAGDALQALAFETLARDIEPAEVAAVCVFELAKAAGATALVGGQADDLAEQSENVDVSQLERVHRRKTGALIGVSPRIGGLIAGGGGLVAGSRRLEALAAYGADLGLAFQITDDLLDVVGSEKELGKRVGKDSDRGKATFPGLLGVEESRRRATALVERATAALAPLGSAAAGLEALARYVLDRNQ